MGRFDKIKFEAGKATIPDSVFRGLGFNQIQRDKAQRLASRMAKLMAFDRRAFGGTAVTEIELEQLKPFLTSMKDQPRTARSVLTALSEDALLRHNSARRQKGLPMLDNAEIFLNDDLKLRVYENEALVPKLKDAGFNNEVINLFKDASPEQRQQVLDLIDTQQEIQESEIIGTGTQSVLEGQEVKLSQETGKKFSSAQQTLAGQGIDLKIADSFRPTSVQKQSFESGKEGVAPPGTSFHEKGDAIDLSQLGADGMEDERVFSALRSAGFVQNPDEWWHWSVGEFNQNA